MQRLGAQTLLSATDFVNFHECEHLTALDLRALDDKALRAQKTKPDEHTELLFQKGNEFEAAPTSFTRPPSWTPTSSATRTSCARCRDPPRWATTATKSSTPSSAVSPRPRMCCSWRSTATCSPRRSSSTRTRCTWCARQAAPSPEADGRGVLADGPRRKQAPPYNRRHTSSRRLQPAAISRARCLSIVVANPGLLDVWCKTSGEAVDRFRHTDDEGRFLQAPLK
jgi:hypothetical protein